MNKIRSGFLISVAVLALSGLTIGCGVANPTAANATAPASTSTSPPPPQLAGATQPSERTSVPVSSLPPGAPLGTLQLVGSSQQVGIWVNGEGKVTATPDITLLSVGVEARASTVEVANTQAAQAMNAVIEALKAKGVRDADIRTQAFNITPEYQFRERESPRIIGYRVANTVQAKMREIGKVGSIIDSVAKAGGDLIRIQGIRFEVDNPAPLLKQARDKAMEDAKAKASQLASLGGVVLGKPTFISESGVAPVQLRQEVRALTAAAAPETPISPGEIQVQITVQVAYAIQ